MTDLIYRERFLHPLDGRLKRHVHHDSRSRLYPFPTAGLNLVSTEWARHIPILDQGNLGSCTGNAGIGCLGTGAFFANHGPDAYTLDEAGAVHLYSDATIADPYPGSYPPEDTGSDGLTIAQVLKAKGCISGYQHTFTLDDALKALTQTPFITGVNWYEGMFTPSADGEVQPTGSIAGGHEFYAWKLDVENERVWFANSWGTGWGIDGTFWLSFANFGRLLGEQGDVTIFVPVSQPAPTPTPPTPPAPPAPDPEVVTPADQVLAGRVRGWAFGRHIVGNARAAAAVRTWLRKKNLT